MTQTGEDPAAENFGFKRLGADNWLHVDPAWSGVFISHSHQDPATGWVMDLSGAQLDRTVPFQVRKLFEVARGAMAYAIMFYPLLTLAIDQITRVMDAAAQEKCRLLGAPSGALKSFHCSVDWLVSKSVVIGEDEAQWRIAVHLRNDASHPSDQSIYGPGMALQLLDWSVDMINSLFTLDA